MAEAVDIKKQIIDDMLETLKEQVSRYKNLINSDDVTLDQLKDFDNQISEIYDTLQKVSNTQLTLLVSEIEDYKTQFQTKLSEFENILNNIDVSNITLNLTPEQIESLKGDNGLNAYQIAVNEGFEGTELEWLETLKGKDFKYEDLTTQQKNDLLLHFNNSQTIQNLSNSIDGINNNFDSFNNVLNNLSSAYDSLNQKIIALENNSGSTSTTPEIPTTDNNSLFINIPADSNSYDYKISYIPQIGDIIEINATLEDGTVLKEDGSIIDYEGNLIFSSNWNYEYPTSLQPAFNINPGQNFLFINNDISDSQGNKLSISQQLEVILIRNETKIKLELLEFTTDRTVSDSWWQ